VPDQGRILVSDSDESDIQGKSSIPHHVHLCKTYIEFQSSPTSNHGQMREESLLDWDSSDELPMPSPAQRPRNLSPIPVPEDAYTPETFADIISRLRNFQDSPGSKTASSPIRDFSSDDGFDPVQHHDGLDPAQRHDGLNPAQRHDGLDPIQRHDGLDPIQRHDSFNPAQRHDSFDPAQRDAIPAISDNHNSELSSSAVLYGFQRDSKQMRISFFEPMLRLKQSPHIGEFFSTPGKDAVVVKTLGKLTDLSKFIVATSSLPLEVVSGSNNHSILLEHLASLADVFPVDSLGSTISVQPCPPSKEVTEFRQKRGLDDRMPVYSIYIIENVRFMLVQRYFPHSVPSKD